MISNPRLAENLVPVHRIKNDSSYASWSMSSLRGRLIQVCSNGCQGAVTSMVPLIRESQQQGEFVAWVRTTPSVPFPPDLQRVGVDLEAMAFIRLSETHDAIRACTHLLRSDGFGLLVVDLAESEGISTGSQGKLVKLAQLHDAAVICLTPPARSDGSMSSLVSLRMQASHERLCADRFRITLEAQKDKRHGPGWTWKGLFDGTPGLY